MPVQGVSAVENGEDRRVFRQVKFYRIIKDNMKIVFTAFARGFNRGKRRFRFAFYKDDYFFNAGGSSRSLALPQDDEVIVGLLVLF
nr:MAG TPA: hypothetical protein [Caudoviricetes sp.]